jgi:redox-regulated HSP33 family molecular chaperone
MSEESSLALEPLTATRLLGGAISSALLMAGRFLSSIFVTVDGRGEAEDVVVRGIRSRVA